MKIDFSKILITGADGMVGSYVDFGIKTDIRDLDIVNLNDVLSMIKKYKPQVIIHLAAETDLEKCESDPSHAYMVNTVGTYNLCLAAKEVDAKLVYISTAGIFDGEKKTPYKENDEANPQNYYGHSKYMGEIIVRDMIKDHLILRACWMFGGGPKKDKKFVAKIIQQLEKPEIKALNDVKGSPTYGKDLIEAIKKLLIQNKTGTFNLSNKGVCTRYDVAKLIVETLNPSVKVTPVDGNYFNLPAKRVKNESMTSKINLMRPWQEALKEYLEESWEPYLNSNKDYYRRKKCRICDSTDLVEILNLGKTPLANSFIKSEDLKSEEKTFPLALNFCKNCSLVQLTHIVDPKLLFIDYHYLTSASKPLVEHFTALADEIADTFAKQKNDLVVEIGSNDGVLLGRIKDRCRVLGVDPAQNVADIAKEKGVDTLCKFFNSEVGDEIAKKHGNAKVIVANNVIAHIDDLKSVFKGVKSLLSKDGVFIFEAHWVGNLISDGGFDQVYHEHLSYFSLHSVKYLCKIFGLTVIDVNIVPIHGESIRFYISKKGKESQFVKNLLKKEKELKLTDLSTYKNFKNKAEKNKQQLNKLLSDLKKQNKKIIGYGAPAKGNTLLNYFNINSNLLDFITDTTPLKQGLFTPGTHIKIFPPEKIAECKPDYIILLSWNYAEQILEKEKLLREKGIKFIIPVPKVKIV
ncbi:MAG: sugar nucleotide-binding protein [Candidatus Paceibacterota bacterium]